MFDKIVNKIVNPILKKWALMYFRKNKNTLYEPDRKDILKLYNDVYNDVYKDKYTVITYDFIKPYTISKCIFLGNTMFIIQNLLDYKQDTNINKDQSYYIYMAGVYDIEKDDIIKLHINSRTHFIATFMNQYRPTYVNFSILYDDIYDTTDVKYNNNNFELDLFYSYYPIDTIYNDVLEKKSKNKLDVIDDQLDQDFIFDNKGYYVYIDNKTYNRNAYLRLSKKYNLLYEDIILDEQCINSNKLKLLKNE